MISTCLFVYACRQGNIPGSMTVRRPSIMRCLSFCRCSSAAWSLFAVVSFSIGLVVAADRLEGEICNEKTSSRHIATRTNGTKRVNRPLLKLDIVIEKEKEKDKGERVVVLLVVAVLKRNGRTIRTQEGYAQLPNLTHIVRPFIAVPCGAQII